MMALNNQSFDIGMARLTRNELQDAKAYIDWVNKMLAQDAESDTAQAMKVKRGEVYWCHFGVNVGSEMDSAQGGRKPNEPRPCVILQNDTGNFFSGTTIIAPITKTVKQAGKLPIVPISKKYDSSNKIILTGYALLTNISTISKARLDGYICDLTDDEMDRIDSEIIRSLGLIEKTNEYEKEIKRLNNYIENLKRPSQN
jgi:mRNA interferase MazF